MGLFFVKMFDIEYLFIMRLRAHIYQIRRNATYAALTIGATRSLLSLGIKLIKPVNGTLKDMTFNLKTKTHNQLRIYNR